jgi:hypothetical protein
MRSSPGSFRLSFLLPEGVAATPGGTSGWVADCEVAIDRVRVNITGPSKEAVIEQAARLVRVICQGRRELEIGAVLESPPPASGRDGWTIIVGADIAFAPTALGVLFPERAVA